MAKAISDRHSRAASHLMGKYTLKGNKAILPAWLLKQLKRDIAELLRFEADRPEPGKPVRRRMKKLDAQLDIESVIADQIGHL